MLHVFTVFIYCAGLVKVKWGPFQFQLNVP